MDLVAGELPSGATSSRTVVVNGQVQKDYYYYNASEYAQYGMKQKYNFYCQDNE